MIFLIYYYFFSGNNANVGLIVGCTLGAVAVVGLLVAGGVYYTKKQPHHSQTRGSQNR